MQENRKITRKEALKRSINRIQESIKIYNNEIQYEYVEWI